jgi:uncharacterized membrane protein YidH (DUF202 family)
MDPTLRHAGTQAERTALGWQRTGIGTMAVGALLVRWHVSQHVLPLWPGALIIAIAGLGVLVLVPQRYRRVLRTVRAGHTPLSRGMVPGMTLLLVLVNIGIGVGIGTDLLNT